MSHAASDKMANSATLVEILRRRAREQPRRRAYTYLSDGEVGGGAATDRHLTYGELDGRARAIAAELQAVVGRGERALLLYPPGLELIEAFFGALYAGVVAVPVHPPHPARPRATVPRLQAIATDVQAKIALSTTTMRSTAGSVLEQLLGRAAPQWLMTDQLDNDSAPKWHDPDVNGASLAFVQYTSGSTAVPKGVMVSHGNLLHNSSLIHQCFEHNGESRGVIWLPPYHDMGLIGGIIQPLYGGFPVELMSPATFLMRPLRWLQAISRARATTSGGPNFAYDLCVRKTSPSDRAKLDLSSWDLAFCGAEPIRHETLEQFVTAFEPCGFHREAFYPCYGLAEATLFVSGGLKSALPVVQNLQGVALDHNQVVVAPEKDRGRRTLVGCGRPVPPHHEVIIVDPETRLLCPPGQVGELWVSGPSVALGYLHRPEETGEIFHAHLADSGEGPFLRTGDLGFFSGGELFITGRLKDLIIIGGRNHYPEDIEQTVEHSHPSIRSGHCAAFSVDLEGQERLVIVAEVDRRYRSRAGPSAMAGPSALKRHPPGRHHQVNMALEPDPGSWVPLEIGTVVRTIRQRVAEEHGLRVHAVTLLRPASFPKTSSGKIQRHLCRAGFLKSTLSTIEA